MREDIDNNPQGTIFIRSSCRFARCIAEKMPEESFLSFDVSQLICLIILINLHRTFVRYTTMKSDGRRCGRMNPMTDLDPQENSYTEAD